VSKLHPAVRQAAINRKREKSKTGKKASSPVHPDDSDIEIPDAGEVPVHSKKKSLLTDPDMSKQVLFYGKPSQLPPVKTFVTVKCLADRESDESAKAALLASTFRGHALDWLTKELQDDPSLLSRGYESFENKVQLAFGLDTEATQSQAARQLVNCRQRTSVQDYTLRFKQLVRESQIPQQTATALFIKGLKPRIKSALIISNNRDSLEEAAEEAQRIDQQLYYTGSGFSGNQNRGTGQQNGARRDNKGRFQGSKTPAIKSEAYY
jgi:hypothetical protein